MRGVLILALIGMPVLAQEEAAAPAVNPVAVSETPEPRPEDVAEVAEDAPEEEVAADDAPATPAGEGERDRLVLNDAEYGQCLAALDELGVSYAEVDPIIPGDDADCGILRPIEVTALAPGIELSTTATLRCPTVRAAGEWLRDFVMPATGRVDRGALTGLDTGPGYVCRRRNGTSDGKPSEHSFGNALDVTGFRFEDGSTIAIEPREADGTLAEAFQDAVRASACLDFATVLGPGSNEAHADHLHLDVKARNGGYRLCEQGGVDPG